MDSEYDRKFDEMKNYIPFLENMIKRLETTSSPSANPRQAQLDKIRSLRDLLLDKNKRMKMENLLKCEQVLVNLYAKVEQRDALPNVKPPTEQYPTVPPKSKDQINLDNVRSRLNAVTKKQDYAVETLPEIARASDVEEVCTPGSKEPALFQRRPNMPSRSPRLLSPINLVESRPNSPQKIGTRRNYTRVLLSPEPSTSNWKPTENSTSESHLFSRRSPRKSQSWTYHKKNKKKPPQKPPEQDIQPYKQKDLNITLNVPQERLHSLNTTDILSRIINCSDSDVDIKTLRELRTQILGELKQTGSNDDISDLILKSYKNKKPASKKKVEVEEGELSDSESEAIENIYGSLVVVEKDKDSTGQASSTSEKNDQQPCKIKICLVINSKESDTTQDVKMTTDTKDFDTNRDVIKTFDVEDTNQDVQSTLEVSNLEKCTEEKKVTKDFNKEDEKEIQVENISGDLPDIKRKEISTEKQCNSVDVITIDDDDDEDKLFHTNSDESLNMDSKHATVDQPTDKDHDKDDSGITNEIINNINNKNQENENSDEKVEQSHDILKSLIDEVNQKPRSENVSESAPFRANFYKPLIEEDSICSTSKYPEKPPLNTTDLLSPHHNEKDIPDIPDLPVTTTQSELDFDNTSEGTSETEHHVEIPLLNEPTLPMKPTAKDVVSEIDILQALKNEILSDNIPIPGSDIITPPLHQPKLIKVASAKEILPKRKISIEKYKERSAPSTTSQLYIKKRDESSSRDDPNKKQSLKLTEKECERFNFPAKVSLADDLSSDNEEEGKSSDYADSFNDLAPKSPDNEYIEESETTFPVIIPADPIKTTEVSFKADIDMRTMLSMPSPNNTVINKITTAANSANEKQTDTYINEAVQDKKQNTTDKNKVTLVDPRVRRDFSQNSNKNSPNQHVVNQDRTPRSLPYSTVTPNIHPNMTPIMTPNVRTYDMTPTHQQFDPDDHNGQKKHVYATSFPFFEGRDHVREKSMCKESRSWDYDSNSGEHRHRWEENKIDRRWEDCDSRSNSCTRELGSQKFHTAPHIDRYKVDRRNKSDCPPTPVPLFAWSDNPNNMNSFGRLDIPTTPIHNFDRSDCPSTPSHSFGRLECPVTPSHPFGRSDCPLTPSHPFGRSECPPTPSHSFGRSECLQSPSHPYSRSDGGRTPIHAFGRSDYSQNDSHKFAKDPRFKRTTDYEASSRYDERERDYCRDIGFHPGKSYKPPSRQYSSGSDTYRNYDREKSVGRSDKNRYSSSEHIGRNFSNDSFQREHSVGRVISRDRESERLYTRERNSRFEYRDRRYEQSVPSPSYRRERSVGRSSQQDNISRSSNRAQSIGRNNRTESIKEKTLSIESHAGRSFTIDTSVNATFQDLIEKKGLQVFDYTFDSHRRRASSVGRSLGRETSVGRSLAESSERRNIDERPHNQNKKMDFRRASSMGRDLVNSKIGSSKSFQEVKADFVNYKRKTDLKVTNVHKTSHKINDNESQTCMSNKSSERCAPYKKHSNETQQEKKSGKKEIKLSYSPRKNYRDPRVRNQQHFDSKYKKYNSRDTRDKWNNGIVYSSDNIAKGTILGRGYGVKNYKIPKIKRVTDKTNEEKQETENSSKRKDNVRGENLVEAKRKSDNEIKSDGKDKKNKQIDEGNVSPVVENAKRRITRSSKKKYSEESKPEDEIVVKRKTKKPIIYDSESDDECTRKKDEIGGKTLNDEAISSEPDNEHAEMNKRKKEDPDSSFGLDDLGIFPDNIVSDPVLDNINALIADLDNDIDTSKTEDPGNFTDEITLETMLESITCSDNIKSLENESFNINSDINSDFDKNINKSTFTLDKTTQENDDTANAKYIEVVNHGTDNLPKNISDNSLEPMNVENSKTTNIEIDKTIHPRILNEEVREINKTLGCDKLSEIDVSNINSDAIVSTTNVDKENLDVIGDKLNANLNDGSNDGCSTPDSTNNTNLVALEITNAGLADSTNEVQHETNSDVTSTHNSADTITKDIAEPCSLLKDMAPTMDSIGSLLSILQNKSKIKELLNMLGDQSSDNDKIKKKLEKLSEIVSDEEEINDENVEKTEVKEKCNENTSLITDDDKQQSALVDTVIEPELETENDGDSKQPEDLVDNETTVTDSTEQFENVEEDQSTKTIDIEQPDNKSDSEQTHEKIEPKKKGTYRKSKRKRLAKVNKNKSVSRIGLNTQTIKTTVKKPSRELQKLQEDIKEMFMSDEILNATGIRMCRLAKLVDDKNINQKDMITQESKPVVVLEKFKNAESVDESCTEKPLRKKPGPKPKNKAGLKDKPTEDISIKKTSKYKPGPKSKTKCTEKEEDPYAFESDSVDTSTIKESDEESENSSESESESIAESLASSKSFGSNEVLAVIKKKAKRKQRGKAWKTGVIKPKNKKKKVEIKNVDEELLTPERDIVIPDLGCFTDKLYCFKKKATYSCRLCVYSGNDIVHHYKKQHPHVEIPLSRMSPDIAREAIEQCKEINFQAVSKIPTDKYVCRFCFKEFAKSRALLEAFFWHVVSTHTGEYKQICSECVTATRCPFNLDIPPPPKDVKGQLIGYICKKCNFTQISLENLKTHVIVRHNDEQTEVYTINLAAMSKKYFKALTRRSEAAAEIPRVLRSSRSNQSATEASDDRSDVTDNSSHISESGTAQSKDDDSLLGSQSSKATPDEAINPTKTNITFEADENSSKMSDTLIPEKAPIKTEQDNVNENEDQSSHADVDMESEACFDEANTLVAQEVPEHPSAASDILVCTHFKINYKESGSKEYICCINGNNHYKTTLLISMKKHVQTKHSEVWDGYCVICKVIVTTQGVHSFKDCFQHFLDKHMDEFPLLDQVAQTPQDLIPDASEFRPDQTSSPKPYINVRPLTQLMTSADTSVAVESAPPESAVPKIERVMTLGASTVEPPKPCPSYPVIPRKETPVEKPVKYEEWQAEVMSKKHRVVLDTMMSRDKLIKVYKCAGRFCSFSSDHAEEALLHASTHQRIGGESALDCAYCDFDASRNAIDLVMHVFKMHGCCQYACAQCFYRAAAGQLVAAHIKNAHHGTSVMGSVLRTTSVSTGGAQYANILTREDAVPYYICGHITTEGDLEGMCKFRTYTQEKFCEHLDQRHEAPHPCNICSMNASSADDLILHMKIHGLKLYQCTWCVHGADTESDLLLHAATVHPAKQPQAYMRIITSKGGSSELRVLPLACLNRAKIPSEDVRPGVADDAVREAERSIELEKLIGHIESATFAEPVETESGVAAGGSRDISNEALPFDSDTPEDTDTRSVSPRALPSKDPNQVQPVIKTESTPEASANLSSDIIYCLDSDEEDSEQPHSNVIDLSDDGPTTRSSAMQSNTEYVKLPVNNLYKCPNCTSTYRNAGGFKKHMIACGPKYKYRKLICAHSPCNKEIHNVNDLVMHYTKDHRGETCSYACGVCDLDFGTLLHVKAHVKEVHKISRVVVASKVGPDGSAIYTAREAGKTGPKRKISADQTKTRRYGPEDVDRLPINPILDTLVHCSLCEFSTKVRLNMVRHLQLHLEQQPVPQTAPVNPVPHLESNEKHFDKMLNLASSSNAARTPEKPPRAEPPAAACLVPPEAASRYPKYVPERHRYTCGAKGCSYISVDEAMLQCHWETLHSTTNDYHCVHCPPYQHLDTTRPLSAMRIVGHLMMHDVTLYACSSCTYYHFKREMVEKHLTEVHKGGQLMIVREEAGAQTSATAQAAGAPTMDLKPWQCGLCKFKSMLRPEVAEHCAKLHQSKMQFKCAYCPFRTSAVENVTKHQSNSHPGKATDVFYYYYRDGSIPDEEDGTPRWLKQRQKTGVPEPEVKSELVDASAQNLPPLTPIAATTPSLAVNLNIVKKEVNEEPNIVVDESIEGLCKKFGEFCEPNGIKYKCSLCQVVAENTREAMQSHLYEELKYRKWGCGLCSYKAFHRAGLNEHMASEHRQQHQEPVALATDVNIEKWITMHLDHQAAIIDRSKNNLIQQKLLVSKVTAGPSTAIDQVPAQPESGQSFSVPELEQAFGSFGAPSDDHFCCPKCDFKVKDEGEMREHMETELSKIRWCCSTCTCHFQTYHEAQFHCRSAHAGLPSRPQGAARDPALRARWVHSLVHAQRQTMGAPAPDQMTTLPDPNENSLLVVRYEENVLALDQPAPAQEEPVRRKRSAHDSDDEKLVIVEDNNQGAKKKLKGKNCPYCDYSSKWANVLKDHVLRHYNLKPFLCPICQYNGYRASVVSHMEKFHPGVSIKLQSTVIPDTPPQMYELPVQRTKKLTQEESNRVICLQCEKYVHESNMSEHSHEGTAVEFARKGEVVVKCCICLVLRLDVKSFQEHHDACHPDTPINYAFFKLHCDSRESHYCGHCRARFHFLRDLKTHHNAVHSRLLLKYTTTMATPGADEEVDAKRKTEDSSILPAAKKVARKSTTKLPNSSAVAKKSTTKLPMSRVESDSESESEMAYSYYGTHPPRTDEYANVTTLMSFCNTMRPFTVKTLRELMEIDPKVIVKDIKK